MPAPAVIPAPIAYIKVVAVKKLVVGFLSVCACPTGVTQRVVVCAVHMRRISIAGQTVMADLSLYFEKIRVFKAGLRYEYISMEYQFRTLFLFYWFLGIE